MKRAEIFGGNYNSVRILSFGNKYFDSFFSPVPVLKLFIFRLSRFVVMKAYKLFMRLRNTTFEILLAKQRSLSSIFLRGAPHSVGKVGIGAHNAAQVKQLLVQVLHSTENGQSRENLKN
jgi:hypothetical protein